MRLLVIPPRADIRARTKGQSSLFVLEQDRWDDFNFQTQYLLHWVDGGTATFIGAVKILKLGQQPKDGLQLKEGPLKPLGRKFCSLGQSLDYYQRLASLGHNQRIFILGALRDVVQEPDIKVSFQREKGWRTSVLRDIKEDDALFTLAPVILTGRYDSLPGEELKFSFSVPGWQQPIEFDFKNPAPGLFESHTGLPERIAVMIGRNGSGKSTVLARIARVAYASTAERDQESLKALGRIVPAGLGFPRILTISYSAFDSFRVPGTSRRDQEQIAKDLDSGAGRFVFCGLRDIARELRAEIRLSERKGKFFEDRTRRTLLKPLGRLAKEYQRAVERVIARGRTKLTKEAMKPLYKDPSFREVEEILDEALEGLDTRADFMAWGAGLKIAVQVVLNLAAYTERRSLVLFDEPETHLHPPLLAALMHSLRYLLEEIEAFAIVATHSPVVLQETLSRHVQIIRREGATAVIASPGIEVFAENIGNVTSDVFGLTSEVTDFHKILHHLATMHSSIDQVEQLFDRGLSPQARAYLMTVFAKKDTKGA
jgi:predicted ATPase